MKDLSVLEHQLKLNADRNFEEFFALLQCTSKANIFNHSLEIERKKSLVIRYKEMISELDENTKNKLLYVDDILDEIYRFDCDNHIEDVKESIEAFLKNRLNKI